MNRYDVYSLKDKIEAMEEIRKVVTDFFKPNSKVDDALCNSSLEEIQEVLDFMPNMDTDAIIYRKCECGGKDPECKLCQGKGVADTGLFFIFPQIFQICFRRHKLIMPFINQFRKEN